MRSLDLTEMEQLNGGGWIRTAICVAGIVGTIGGAVALQPAIASMSFTAAVLYC